MPKLRQNERCPLHGRRDCCGRAEFKRYQQPKHELKWRFIRPGVKLYPDGREVCSAAEMRRRKNHLLATMHECHACGKRFEEYSDVELGHRFGKGFDGAKRRDNYDNLVLLCVQCNRDQGSMDLCQFIEKLRSKQC